MKHPAKSSEPLPNSRHEAFAREVASGRSATQAYRNVYGSENRRVASTGGSRLLRRKSIVARIKAMQKAGAAGVVLDLQEIHDFLTRVVRTPAGDIVPSSDLCTRVKHTRDGATDVWMPDKLACLRLSAKLQGFLDKSSWMPESDPSDQAPSDSPFVLTEERREILMARRRAVIEAYKKQDEEERLAQEKPPESSATPPTRDQTQNNIPSIPSIPNKPEPTHCQTHPPERGAGLPTRDQPLAPPSNTKPTTNGHKPAPAKPRLHPTTPGPWIPHWLQNQPSTPNQTQNNRPSTPARPEPKPCDTPTAQQGLTRAEALRDAHGAAAQRPSCGPRAAALNPQPSTINRPSFSRVTPDSSSAIVII